MDYKNQYPVLSFDFWKPLSRAAAQSYCTVPTFIWSPNLNYSVWLHIHSLLFTAQFLWAEQPAHQNFTEQRSGLCDSVYLQGADWVWKFTNSSLKLCVQLFRINEANQLMQYDQCLTRGDNAAVIITHCDRNQYTEWKYFKVRPHQPTQGLHCANEQLIPFLIVFFFFWFKWGNTSNKHVFHQCILHMGWGRLFRNMLGHPLY